METTITGKCDDKTKEALGLIYNIEPSELIGVPAQCPVCGGGDLVYQHKYCRIKCLNCERYWDQGNMCPDCDWLVELVLNPDTDRFECPECGFYFGRHTEKGG